MTRDNLMLVNAALNQINELESCLYHLGKKGYRVNYDYTVMLRDLKINLQSLKELLRDAI